MSSCLVMPVGVANSVYTLMSLNGFCLQAYLKELESSLYQSEGINANQRMHDLSSEVTQLVFWRFGHQPSQRTALFTSMMALHHIPPDTKPSFSTELLVRFLFPSVGCPLPRPPLPVQSRYSPLSCWWVFLLLLSAALQGRSMNICS